MVGRIGERGRATGRGPSALDALAALVAAIVVASAVAAPARAQEESTIEEPGRRGSVFVSEIIDSTYFVGPAEFFALDLPSSLRGASAVHVFGEISVVGSGKRDIIVRLFRSVDYQNWLKRRGGSDPKALWSSQRSRTVRLDQDIPAGTRVVLLLDNGYSIRTPKRVRVQIQLHFQEGTGVRVDTAEDAPHAPAAAPEEGEIVPRGNAEEEVPPPPPPPPDDATN